MYIDPPECGSGFMSVETMHTLVGLGEVGRLIGYNRRQQITPSITFTCNGWITKWIIGAIWDDENKLFPELQIWRNDGNNTYRKINGTFISLETSNPSLIYEYSDFSAIPFQAGDILGAFTPRSSLSKLILRLEDDRGHLNYYMRTNIDATESPYDSIDLSEIDGSATYHPLVSVEISTSYAATKSPHVSIDLSGPLSSATYHPLVSDEISKYLSIIWVLTPNNHIIIFCRCEHCYNYYLH